MYRHPARRGSVTSQKIVVLPLIFLSWRVPQYGMIIALIRHGTKTKMRSKLNMRAVGLKQNRSDLFVTGEPLVAVQTLKVSRKR